MQSEGMIEDLVRNLSSVKPQLKMLSASAIFRLAEEDESRHLVRLHGGLEPLVEMIAEGANHENKVGGKKVVWGRGRKGRCQKDKATVNNKHAFGFTHKNTFYS